jgi:hypothetical protein
MFDNQTISIPCPLPRLLGAMQTDLHDLDGLHATVGALLNLDCELGACPALAVQEPGHGAHRLSHPRCESARSLTSFGEVAC